MADDKLIESLKRDNQEKQELLKSLQMQHKANKLANESGDPQIQSATQELIQRLRQPREQKQDLRPLLGFLSDPQDAYLLSKLLPEQQAISPEEERLAMAAKLEGSIADRQIDKLGLIAKTTVANTGDLDKDMRALEKVGSMASGTGRGATNMRKAWENVASIDKLKSMAEDFSSGQLTFDPQSNMEYSSAISALITNRAPGIEIIRETAYSNFGGDINKMIQYITGNPQEALSKEMMKEIDRQIYNIEKSEKHKISKTLSRLFNAYRGRFKRNPEDATLWKEQYGHLVDFDLDKMSASPKPYDEVGETRLGREKTQEKKMSKLEQFRKLMGR